jgi:hypothetical protein
MTVTIELPPEVEVQLHRAAARQHQNPVEFVTAAVAEKLQEEESRIEQQERKDVVHDRLSPSRQPEEAAGLSTAEDERLLDELAANGKNLPVLPPEANSRERIYADRDECLI